MDINVVKKSSTNKDSVFLCYQLLHCNTSERSYYSIKCKSVIHDQQDSVKVDDITANSCLANQIFDAVAAGMVRPCHLNDVIYNILSDIDKFREVKERSFGDGNTFRSSSKAEKEVFV